MSESETRTNQLRALLVERTESRSSSRQTRWRLGAMLTAVAIVSGTTGAVSAGAIARSDPYQPNVIASLALSVARAESVLIGDPFFVAASGSTTIELGSSPANATGIAIRMGCTSPGSIEVALDGDWISSLGCDPERSTGGGGFVAEFSGAGTHTLDFRSDSDTGYEAWVAWVEEPALPGPSNQQRAELADGVVSRDEYLAAFYRYSGCLAADGFEIAPADPSALILSYIVPSAAVDSGSEERCYQAQFVNVDSAWQTQNENAS